jgi:hypothetical protein
MLLDELGGAPKLGPMARRRSSASPADRHASGFIHTLRWHRFREAVGGTSTCPSPASARPAGCSDQIPMMHKTDEGFRSPLSDPRICHCRRAPAGRDRRGPGRRRQRRAHPRIGNRYLDIGGDGEGEGRRRALTGTRGGSPLRTLADATRYREIGTGEPVILLHGSVSTT